MALTNPKTWRRALSDLRSHYQIRQYFSDTEISAVKEIWDELKRSIMLIEIEEFPGYGLIPESTLRKYLFANEAEQFVLLSVLCVAFLTTRRNSQSVQECQGSEISLHQLFDQTVPEIQHATAMRMAEKERLRQERLETERQAKIEAEAQQRAKQEEAERLIEELKRERERLKAEEARKRLERESFIEAKLNSVERGIRVWWQTSVTELALLAGDEQCVQQVLEIKRRLAREWLDRHCLRATNEQLEFIVDTHHSIRVTARAGSGKTETLATKILFLLHFIGLSQENILALVFNIEARDHLIKRITDLEKRSELSTKGPYAVMNFDRLARGVVKPQANILKGVELSKKVQELVYFFLSGQSEHSHLIKEVMLTSFQADWDKWLRNNERYSAGELDQLRSLLNEESIDGRSVKSKGEKRIADFFYEHNIDYQYEYPWRTDRGVVIYPDFRLPQYRIVIEFLGLSRDKD